MRAIAWAFAHKNKTDSKKPENKSYSKKSLSQFPVICCNFQTGLRGEIYGEYGEYAGGMDQTFNKEITLMKPVDEVNAKLLSLHGKAIFLLIKLRSCLFLAATCDVNSGMHMERQS